jgi:hypothetical protein
MSSKDMQATTSSALWPANGSAAASASTTGMAAQDAAAARASVGDRSVPITR